MTTRTDLPDARRFLAGLAEERGRPLRLLAAVSGGLDSMCLLRLLLDWTAERGGTVLVAHFNHRLRGGAADRDEAFVREWCGKNGVAFLRGEGDTRALAGREGLTVEEAARRLRYDFLERAAAENGCDWVLTAHHADDNAETMLLNLVRGTGSRGLAGIPRVRGNVARPLLGAARAELEDYAAANGVPHVEDETNADPDAAARNLLRQRVMPLLRELNPRAARNMGRAAAILGRERDFMDREVRALAGRARRGDGAARIPRQALLEAHEALAGAAVLELLASVCGKRRDLSAMDAGAVLALCRGGEGELRLAHGLLVRREKEDLVIARLPPRPEAVPLRAGQAAAFGPWSVALDTGPEGGEYACRLALPEGADVSVTPWRSGDRMTLPGASGGRTLKRLCADAGLRPWQRDALPVLRVDGAPAAVPGVGIDAAFAPRAGEAGVAVTFYKHIEEDGHEDKRNGE